MRMGNFRGYEVPVFPAPEKACDCHVHVFGPADEFPYGPERKYTPVDATPADCAEMLASLGLQRVVLVQPTPYGSDNSRLIAALKEFGKAARGVAVLQGYPSKPMLEELTSAGIRATRLNFGPDERPDAKLLCERLSGLAELIEDYGWHIQLSLAAELLPEIESVTSEMPVPVVLEHMARLPAKDHERHAGYDSLRRMLDSGRVWVKLSAPYRLAGGEGNGRGAAGLARDLMASAPERMVWGSDWPHTPKRGPDNESSKPLPFRKLDTGALFNLIADWFPDKKAKRRILAENPARLYGFD